MRNCERKVVCEHEVHLWDAVRQMLVSAGYASGYYPIAKPDNKHYSEVDFLVQNV